MNNREISEINILINILFPQVYLKKDAETLPNLGGLYIGWKGIWLQIKARAGHALILLLCVSLEKSETYLASDMANQESKDLHIWCGGTQTQCGHTSFFERRSNILTNPYTH